MLDFLSNIFISVDDKVKQLIDIEKSIQENKDNALQISQDFSPIIKDLEEKVGTCNIYYGLCKSNGLDCEDILIKLERYNSKLKEAREDLEKSIGDLRKENIKLEKKKGKLLKSESVKITYSDYKKEFELENSLDNIIKGFDNELINEEVYLNSVIGYFVKSLDEDLIEKSILGPVGDQAIELIRKALEQGEKQRKVAKVMREFKEGKLKSGSGEKVTDKKQSMAIAMSEAGLSKAEDDKYKKKLEKLNEIRDPEGIEKGVNSEPTEAQKSAGNYKKDKKQVRGLTVTIENPKGSTRSGKNEDGTDWSIKMNNYYGYFNKTKGKDGDHIDVFLSDKPEEGSIYVIDQLKADGKSFDEHKIMMGYPTEESALKAYKGNYDFDIKYKGVSEIDTESLKKWLDLNTKGVTKRNKPYSDLKKSIEDELEKSENEENKKKGKSIEEQAKNASGKALEKASEDAKDPKVRVAAHKEIDRREKEEKIKDEESDTKKEEKETEK